MYLDSPLPPNIALDQLIASYGIVEELSQNKEYLKDVIELAKEVAGSTVCYISILDSARQYIISSEGMTEFPTEKKDSVCQFTVLNKKLTIIDNLSCDENTCHLEVAKGKHVYYAGFPLINSDDIAIGSLCIMDVEAKNLNTSQIKVLHLVAKSVVERLDTRRKLIKLIKEINTNFEPGECSDLFCLSGELGHLHKEVIQSKEQLELEQNKLKVSNRNLSQFAYRVAHDIKAPLRSISAFSRLIQKNGSDSLSPEKNADYFEFIKTSINELNGLVDNLLNLAEFKAKITPEKVSISELVDNIEVLFFQSIKDNQVELIKPNIDIQVFGYKTLLKQVFRNIISNGIKYSDKAKDSFVKVTFELQEDAVQVEISDNGIGISEGDLKSIFDPFKRVSNQSEVSGLGIGLDTCSMILKDMGTELRVKSELGVGSSFLFEIPIN